MAHLPACFWLSGLELPFPGWERRLHCVKAGSRDEGLRSLALGPAAEALEVRSPVLAGPLWGHPALDSNSPENQLDRTYKIWKFKEDEVHVIKTGVKVFKH